MDGNIQRMTELAGILQGDEKYVRLSGISGSPDTKDYYTIRKLQEELIRLSRFQDVPLKFFILFNDCLLYTSRITIKVTKLEKI